MLVCVVLMTPDGWSSGVDQSCRSARIVSLKYKHHNPYSQWEVVTVKEHWLIIRASSKRCQPETIVQSYQQLLSDSEGRFLNVGST